MQPSKLSSQIFYFKHHLKSEINLAAKMAQNKMTTISSPLVGFW